MYPLKGEIAFVVLICFIFTSWQIKADSSPKTIPEVKYQHYNESEGKEYQQFLPPAPEGMWYYTRMKGIGNVDNPSEKEEVVLITVQPNSDPESHLVQAFLLVCTEETGILRKKNLLKLYDHEAEETSSQNVYPSLVFNKVRKFSMPVGGSLELVDLNKDGILDIWFRLPYYIAVVSFQNGMFKQIFNSLTVPGADSPEPRYVDRDADGLYEIEIPNTIYIKGIESAAHPTWISLYEWDGKAYVLNNQKFYSRDTDILIHFLQKYNDQLFRKREPERYFEEYEFYIGLIYYYRGQLYRAREYMERVVMQAKNENYVREARAILKRLAETGNPDFAPREGVRNSNNDK